MSKPLTTKQETFCLAILAGKNQSDAYREAYDCKCMRDVTVHVEASRLMDHPRIVLRIQVLMTPAVEKVQMNYDQFVTRLVRLCFFDPRNMFDQSGNLLPIPDMGEDEVLAIAAFRKTPHFLGKAGNRKMAGMTTKLKFVDRVKAMELLGKAKGWFK